MSPFNVTADEAAEPPPEWGKILRRGLTRRCPRCGGGKLFRNWWSIKDRCPRCGLSFVREEGYFTGVYLLNLSLVLAVLFVLCMGFAVWLSENPGASLVPALAVGVTVALALPIVSYPFARTTWIALDLLANPMELEEIADAMGSDDGDEDEDA